MERPPYQKYNFRYPVVGDSGKGGGIDHYDTFGGELPYSRQHITPATSTRLKPTKKQHVGDNADKAEDFTKAKWLTNNEADDNEIASNSILDQAQYNNNNNNNKKNESKLTLRSDQLK